MLLLTKFIQLVFWLIKQYKIPFIILFLTLVFFHKIILNPTDMIYPAYDIGTYSFSKQFIIETINTFKYVSLWNPYFFAGTPFVGNPEAAMFYPTNFLFFFIPTNLAFGYVFIINIFLIGIFTYLFAKEIKIDKFSAFLSAIITMFSGGIMAKIIPAQIFTIESITWFPLLMLMYQKTLSSNKIIYGVLSGIPIAFMLLAGTTQIALYAICIALLFFSFIYTTKNLFQNKRNSFKKILFAPPISLIVGFTLAAVQLIPSFEFAKLSARANGLSYEFASDFSLHPYQLITIFLPHFFGSPLVTNSYWGLSGNFWELCFYSGILPIFLALIAFAYKRNKYTIFFTSILVFSLLFAFGRFFPFFKLFYDYFPGFDLFRGPTRILFLSSFSISILAGFGLSKLTNDEISSREKKGIGLIVFLILTLSIASIFVASLITKNNLVTSFIALKGLAIRNDHNAIQNLIVNDLILLALLAFLSSILILAKIRNILKPVQIKLLAGALIIFDLWIFSIKFYTTIDPDLFFKTPSYINVIKQDKTKFRIFDVDGDKLFLHGINKIESLSGFGAFYLKNYREFLWLSGDHLDTPYESFFAFRNIKNLNILKLLNTKYIITRKPLSIDGIEKVYDKKESIYKINGTLPRAYVVPNAVVLKSKQEIFTYLKKTSFDPKKMVILENSSPYPVKNSSTFNRVSISTYEPNRIEMQTYLENPGYLVLSEIWYPGWKAYDNRKETEIFKANYIFRSIYIQKGKHDITFIYDPDSYKIGKTISIISFLAIIMYIIHLRKRY